MQAQLHSLEIPRLRERHPLPSAVVQPSRAPPGRHTASLHTCGSRHSHLPSLIFAMNGFAGSAPNGARESGSWIGQEAGVHSMKPLEMSVPQRAPPVWQGSPARSGACERAVLTGVGAGVAARVLLVLERIGDRVGCGAVQRGEVDRHSVVAAGRDVKRNP